jgi:hypothetical protein
MGVSSQGPSFGELARFLRSTERRKFAPSQTTIECDPDYFVVNIRTGIRVLNKEQK